MSQRGIDIVSTHDSYTTTSNARTKFGMLAVFAEFERGTYRRRT